MVVLITGATDGLGRALAERLAGDGTTLILHGRDRARLDQAADAVEAASGGRRPATVLADLADLAQVRRMAREVTRLTDRLDVLINNAGIGAGEPDGLDRRVSADGYELRFAVNHLAGFLLALELLPLLRSSARPGVPARIVPVASLGQQAIDFDDVMLERDYSGNRAYCQSKLAQIMTGFELAGRLAPTQVTVNSLHPGTYMPTKIVFGSGLSPVDSLSTGVESTRRLAIDPALATTTGRFFDRRRDTRAHEQAYDPKARAQLWELSLALVDHPGIG
ncbi:MAG: SDR family NAD(P)-dependent oxidoreductase [Frankia sp.]|nr:SDR family NAD(P)-dependent oxidoreductase [Frankia sp.]